MTEVNFCPYCDAPQHKILIISEAKNFCKSCNTFFNLTEEKHACTKCGSEQLEISDFSSPSGDVIFHCRKCKKMFKAKEILG